MTIADAARVLINAGLDVELETACNLMDGVDMPCEPLDVMLALGLGVYREDRGELMPVSRAVYAFDCEVDDIETMYTVFLEGIDRIVPDIEITDIEEDLDGMTEDMDFDGEIPTDGTRAFSFLCNGHPYAMELESRGDWFNEKAIAFIGDVLRKEGCPGRLCGVGVMAIQGIMLFYGQEEIIENVLRVLGVKEGETIL